VGKEALQMAGEATGPGRIVYLDPTVDAEPRTDPASAAAARVGSLDGRVLGLLGNGKVNADPLLRLVRDGLRARYRLRDVVQRAKPDSSRPAPAPLLDELARRCDVVVTAIGD
jgi:hypothetical protein